MLNVIQAIFFESDMLMYVINHKHKIQNRKLIRLFLEYYKNEKWRFYSLRV